MERLTNETACTVFEASVQVTRQDIIRAKAFLVQHVKQQIPMRDLLAQWNTENGFEPRRPNVTILVTSEEARPDLQRHGRCYSLELALCQAIWELIGTGLLVPLGETSIWRPPDLLANDGRGSYGLGIEKSASPTSPCPNAVAILPLRAETYAFGIDLLLGHSLPQLHEGVRQALSLAVECLRRDLFLPSIAMLAAAAEAQ